MNAPPGGSKSKGGSSYTPCSHYQIFLLMKCPHCSQSISIQSHAKNIFAKLPTCPRCEGTLIRELDYKFVGLMAVPLLVITTELGNWMGGFSFIPGVVLLLALGYDFKAPAQLAPPLLQVADGTAEEKA